MGRAANKYEYRCENPSCREVFLPSKELQGQVECPACKGFLKLVRPPDDIEGAIVQSMIDQRWGSFDKVRTPQLPSLGEIMYTEKTIEALEHLEEEHTLTCTCGWNQVFTGPAPKQANMVCPSCSDPLSVGQSSPPKEEVRDTLAQHYIAERGVTHGPNYPIAANFIQWLKEKMEYQTNWDHLMADQKESLHMIATKLGRILHGDPNHIDHWDDLAGYATLISNRLREDAASEALDTVYEPA